MFVYLFWFAIAGACSCFFVIAFTSTDGGWFALAINAFECFFWLAIAALMLSRSRNHHSRTEQE